MNEVPLPELCQGALDDELLESLECDLTNLELQWGRTIGQFPSPYTRANPLTVPYRWDQGP